MNQNFTKFAFTDSVKKAQERYGTRRSYARMETAGDRYTLIEKEASFIRTRDSLYIRIMEADQDTKLLHRLKIPDYKARIERLVILAVQAYDWNCPQHITPRYTIEEINALTVE